MRRVVALAWLTVVAQPASALAEPFDPIDFAVRGSTSVSISNFGAFPPVFDEDLKSVDEVFGADTLPLMQSSLTGSGATAGYAGTSSTLVTDSIIGVFASGTSAGTQGVGVTVSGGSGYIDYFTVLLPVGSFVPMAFTIEPSYTISATGSACANLFAGVQIAGGGSAIPTIGGVNYVDSTCLATSFMTSVELMVPTGVPFRVLLEMSASVFFAGNLAGTGTVDALNSLKLFADPVGNFSYETMSGNDFLSSPPAVPEPATVSMIGAGVLLLASRRRRMR
jgi:hypothetical protein